MHRSSALCGETPKKSMLSRTAEQGVCIRKHGECVNGKARTLPGLERFQEERGL